MPSYSTLPDSGPRGRLKKTVVLLLVLILACAAAVLGLTIAIYLRKTTATSASETFLSSTVRPTDEQLTTTKFYDSSTTSGTLERQSTSNTEPPETPPLEAEVQGSFLDLSQPGLPVYNDANNTATQEKINSYQSRICQLFDKEPFTTTCTVHLRNSEIFTPLIQRAVENATVEEKVIVDFKLLFQNDDSLKKITTETIAKRLETVGNWSVEKSKMRETYFTEAWTDVQNFLNSAMNKTVDPCEDFFEYACGHWTVDHPIPEHSQRYRVPTWMQEKVFNLIDDELGKSEASQSQIMKLTRVAARRPKGLPARGYSKHPKDFALRKVAPYCCTRYRSILMTSDAYQKCMINASEANLAAIWNMLDRFHIPFPAAQPNNTKDQNSSADISKLLGEWHKNFGDWGILEIATEPNVGSEDVSNYVFTLKQGALTLGSRDRYLNSNFSTKAYEEFHESFAETVKKLYEIAHKKEWDPLWNDSLSNEFQELWDFEVQLANISLPSTELRNHTKLWNPVSLEELESMLDYNSSLSDNSSFTWERYFETFLQDLTSFSKNTTTLAIYQIEYFKQFPQILLRTKVRTIHNYLAFRTVQKFAHYVDNLEKSTSERFVKPLPPLRERCLKDFLDLLIYPMGRLYVEAAKFGEFSRHTTDDLIARIEDAFMENLKSVNFLDEVSRQNAERKLKGVIRNDGYPDWILRDADLDKFYYYSGDSHNDCQNSTTSWVECMQFLISGKVGIEAKKYQKGTVDRTDFIMSPALINAWYEPELNSITFPAAVLQSPVFRPKGPAAFNFGGIGTVMGHELTHGFDDEGVQYDWVGSLNTWMSAESQKSFRNMADCIVDEYTGFCYDDLNGHRQCLNGIANQGENIADNGGIRQAYNAFRKYSEETTFAERPIPGHEELSPDQMFFIGFTSFWCGQNKPKFLENLILTNPHSPSEKRVFGTVRNMEEFSRAFNCPVDSPMNPSKKCYVWSNPP